MSHVTHESVIMSLSRPRLNTAEQNYNEGKFYSISESFSGQYYKKIDRERERA